VSSAKTNLQEQAVGTSPTVTLYKVGKNKQSPKRKQAMTSLLKMKRHVKPSKLSGYQMEI